jgi:hypothetical protein
MDIAQASFHTTHHNSQQPPCRATWSAANQHLSKQQLQLAAGNGRLCSTSWHTLNLGPRHGKEHLTRMYTELLIPPSAGGCTEAYETGHDRHTANTSAIFVTAAFKLVATLRYFAVCCCGQGCRPVTKTCVPHSNIGSWTSHIVRPLALVLACSRPIAQGALFHSVGCTLLANPALPGPR